MSADFEIKNDKNPKNSSCGGSVEISYDGGKTYEVIGHGLVLLDVDWDHPDLMDLVDPNPVIGEPIEYSTGYTVSATGNVAFFDDLVPMRPSTGIVNHRHIAIGHRLELTNEEVLNSINSLLEEFESSIPIDGITLLACSPEVQICINALKKDHYASLGKTGGSMATGKGKKAHKKMHRKMFGGW